MERVLNDVRAERDRQDGKWGVQRLPFPVWSLVLTEETGELSKEVLERRADPVLEQLRAARTEAIQVAAVAVAMVEHLDEYLEEHS